jgi:hypothetical protein
VLGLSTLAAGGGVFLHLSIGYEIKGFYESFSFTKWARMTI